MRPLIWLASILVPTHKPKKKINNKLLIEFDIGNSYRFNFVMRFISSTSCCGLWRFSFRSFRLPCFYSPTSPILSCIQFKFLGTKLCVLTVVWPLNQNIHVSYQHCLYNMIMIEWCVLLVLSFMCPSNRTDSIRTNKRIQRMHHITHQFHYWLCENDMIKMNLIQKPYKCTESINNNATA